MNRGWQLAPQPEQQAREKIGRLLAAKLAGVSSSPLQETSTLGSWHGDLFTLDRRQCMMFCHNATRFVLFMAGLRKEQFAKLSSKWFRLLYTATQAMSDCPDTQIRKAELVLSPMRFDTATDRSVQGSLRVARRGLEVRLYDVRHGRDLDPLALSCRLNERPATVCGQWVRLSKALLDPVAAL